MQLFSDIINTNYQKIINEIFRNHQQYHPDSINYDLENKIQTQESKDSIPFKDIFIPFILYAKQTLIDHLPPSANQILTPEVCYQFEHDLLRKLSHICSPTLALKFSIYREMEQPGISRRLVAEKNVRIDHQKSKGIYLNFVRELLKGGLLEIFKEYPMLAKFVVMAIVQWCSNVQIFSQRLSSDWNQIQERFHSGRDLGKVISLQSNLSDPHHNGRSVIILIFSSGLKIVYKPKNLSLASEFQNLLTWCTQNGLPRAFKPYRIINQNEYGWEEYVDFLPCNNREAARSYYFRAGMLLCLIYLLNGSDCHFENIIAHGEYPVLIDCETLFQPQHTKLQFENGNCIRQSAIENCLVDSSVLITGLLPHKKQFKRQYDISGFGGIGGQETGTMVTQWENINTDKMVIKSRPLLTWQNKNIPFYNNNYLLPDKFLNHIIEGFGQVYRFFINKRQLLIDKNGPLENFKYCKTRYIFRATRAYVKIQHILLQSRHLHSKMDQDRYLDLLYRPFPFSQYSKTFLTIIAEEKRALTRLDVPIFHTAPDTRDVYLSDSKIIKDFFLKAGFDVVISKIGELDEKDLKAQIRKIVNSFISYNINHN